MFLCHFVLEWRESICWLLHFKNSGSCSLMQQSLPHSSLWHFTYKLPHHHLQPWWTDLEPTTAPSRSICHCSLASKHNFPNTQAIILNINWTPNYLEINKSELQTANIPVLRPTQHHVMTLCPYKPSTMWLQIQPPSLQNNQHVTYHTVQCIKSKRIAINGTSIIDPQTSNYLQVWSSDIQMTGMMTPAITHKYLDHFMHQANQANMHQDKSHIPSHAYK